MSFSGEMRDQSWEIETSQCGIINNFETIQTAKSGTSHEIRRHPRVDLVSLPYLQDTGLPCLARISSPFVRPNGHLVDIFERAFAFGEANTISTNLPWVPILGPARHKRNSSDETTTLCLDIGFKFPDATCLPFAPIKNVMIVKGPKNIRTSHLPLPNEEIVNMIISQPLLLRMKHMVMDALGKQFSTLHFGWSPEAIQTANLVKTELLVDEGTLLKVIDTDRTSNLNLIRIMRICSEKLVGECLLRLRLQFSSTDRAIVHFILHGMQMFRDANTWNNNIFNRPGIERLTYRRRAG